MSGDWAGVGGLKTLCHCFSLNWALQHLENVSYSCGLAEGNMLDSLDLELQIFN